MTAAGQTGPTASTVLSVRVQWLEHVLKRSQGSSFTAIYYVIALVLELLLEEIFVLQQEEVKATPDARYRLSSATFKL